MQPRALDVKNDIAVGPSFQRVGGAGGCVQLARRMGTSNPRVVLFGPGPSTRAMSESSPTLRYVSFRGKSWVGFSKTSVVAETLVDRKSA